MTFDFSPQAFAAVQGGGTFVQPTLIARDVRLQRALGQRHEFSFYDAKLANLAYCYGEKFFMNQMKKILPFTSNSILNVFFDIRSSNLFKYYKILITSKTEENVPR